MSAWGRSVPIGPLGAEGRAWRRKNMRAYLWLGLGQAALCVFQVLWTQFTTLPAVSAGSSVVCGVLTQHTYHRWSKLKYELWRDELLTVMAGKVTSGLWSEEEVQAWFYEEMDSYGRLPGAAGVRRWLGKAGHWCKPFHRSRRTDQVEAGVFPGAERHGTSGAGDGGSVS